MRQGGIECLKGLACALAFAAALVGLGPRAGRAQECVTVFKDQTAGAVVDGGTVCQTAVGKKCTFHVALCVNQQQEGCTPADLGSKRLHASGLCLPVPNLKVHASGTSSACGSFVGVKVRPKGHGTKAGQCRIHAKAGTDLDAIRLLCQPQPGLCPTTTTTTTTTTIPGPTCASGDLECTSPCGDAAAGCMCLGPGCLRPGCASTGPTCVRYAGSAVTSCMSDGDCPPEKPLCIHYSDPVFDGCKGDCVIPCPE